MKSALNRDMLTNVTKITQTTLITMITPNQTTGSVIENARLVVQADRIQAVPSIVSSIHDCLNLLRLLTSQLGPLVDVACPTGAIDMDMSGYVVLPGYIDAHSHWAGAKSSVFVP